MSIKRIDISNKKATFNFHVEQKYTCGMQLTGSEVKSIRAGNINMADSYIRIESKQLILFHMHIGLFRNALFNAHVEPMRPRTLLATKKELARIDAKAKTKGYAIFPIRLFENERGIFKLEIGLGQGKKLYDKREDLKQKDIKRQIKEIL